MKGKFPYNYVNSVLVALQSTSCKDFNAHFRKIQLEREQSEATQFLDVMNHTIGSILPSSAPPLTELQEVDRYLLLADALYQAHVRKQTWSAKKAPGPAASILKHGTHTNPCFNCQKVGCYPGICEQPLDEGRIARNRKTFLSQKKQSQPRSVPATPSSSGKAPPVPSTSPWRPPASGESVLRMISPKTGLPPRQYRWIAANKRWSRVSAAKAALNVTVANPAPVSLPPVTSSDVNEIRALFAGLQLDLNTIKESL
jgi:hypothetical protein